MCPLLVNDKEDDLITMNIVIKQTIISAIDSLLLTLNTLGIEVDLEANCSNCTINCKCFQLMREEILTLEKIELDLPDDSSCYNPNNV